MKNLLRLLFSFTFMALLSHAGLAQSDASQEKKMTIPVSQHYEGGEEALVKFIEDKLVYPPMAKRNRIQGTCIVTFKLDEFGKTSDFKVVKNIGGSCGDEALRIVKLMNFNAPGYNANYSVPINFVIK